MTREEIVWQLCPCTKDPQCIQCLIAQAELITLTGKHTILRAHCSECLNCREWLDYDVSV